MQAERLDPEFAVSHAPILSGGGSPPSELGVLLGDGLDVLRGGFVGLRSRGCAPVLGGRNADLVKEKPGEVALRGKAELGRYLRDLALARREARDRRLDAQHVEVGARREAGAELKEVVEARARQAHLAGELVDTEIL